MFLSRGDRDLGVAFQTHPGRQAYISSGSKEPRSALASRRVSLGAHWVDSRESSLLRRLESGRISRRQRDITLLDARAGSPPSGSELLRRHAKGQGLRTLEEMLLDWEHWAAELLEAQI